MAVKMTKVKKVIARTLDEALEKRYPAVKESFDEIELSVLNHLGQDNNKSPIFARKFN